MFRIGVFFMFVLVFGSIGLVRLVGTLAERAGFQPPREAIALFVLFFAFVIVPGVFFSGMRRIGFPLGDIVGAAERVGRGDYSAKLVERGPPFLRKVARAFNTMTTRLDAQEQLRRNLMADVAHELRTPLSVIRGRLEGLLDGVYARDDATVEQLIEETKLLERLVEDLRTLAHAEGGTLRLQRESTDIGVLIHEVVHSFEVAARAREVDLSASQAGDLPLVDIDPFRIREVLTNLVTNALRHTPPRGQVVIAATAESSQLRVDVADTGSGIAPDDLARVFDRFAKGADSQGSGLGLAIARNLIAAHGGEISARNRPEGGAVFSFTLPIA
jgi:two-component system OmpR family sensor kinase/two-component system sensor histidine kinase BaeS